MPMETRSNSALFKRAEQLKRWEEFEANNKCEISRKGPENVKFTDGCVFLAACAAGDTEEVERLLSKSADINTANVDGLTALHQACIDDNLNMVEFLVEHGCDVNHGDNEGWTPLHATASCGFLSIAKYLLEHGASVAAVNNDGELPIDIAESEEMEELLQAEIDKLGIDCDAARTGEENLMMKDAQDFLFNKQDHNNKIHPKTGATALHVAAAKGYIKVLSILIKAGLELNAQDNDGWTALHAAAHWGQKEACELLADNLANMDIQNFAGQTCFDVADPDLVNLLQDLKNKQNTLQKERPELGEILRRKAPPPLKRRTSVTRMSCTDKSNVVMKDTYAERAQIEAKLRLPEEDLEEDNKGTVNDAGEENTFETKQKEALNVVIPKRENDDLDLFPNFYGGNKFGQVDGPHVVKKNEANIVDSLSEIIPSTEITKEEELPVRKYATNKEQQNDVAPWRRRNEPTAPLKSSQDIVKEEPILVLRKPKKSRTIDEDKKTNGPSFEGPTKERKSSTEDIPSVVSSTTTVTTLSSPTSTPSTPPIGVTTPPVEGQVRRSSVLPIRDEESETRRKAHAKRVRETRRSTTGVTLEELKSAEQQFLRKQKTEVEKKDKTKQTTEPIATTSVISTVTATTTTTTSNSTQEKRGSWRMRGKESEKAEQAPIRKSQNLPATGATAGPNLDAGTPAVTFTAPARTRQQLAVTNVPESPETTQSVTLPLRPRPVPSEEADKDHENKNALGTQAAIQRRKRPKRRSTGVVYWDNEGQSEQKSKTQEQEQEDVEEKSQEFKGDGKNRELQTPIVLSLVCCSSRLLNILKELMRFSARISDHISQVVETLYYTLVKLVWYIMPYGSYGYTSGHRQGPSYTYGKPSVSSSHSASGYSYGSGSKYSPNYGGTATYGSLIPSSNQRSYFRDSPTSGSHWTDSPQSINLDTPSSGHSLHRESSGSSSYKGYDSAYQSQSPKFSRIVEGKDKTLVAPYSSSSQYSVLPSQDCSLTSSKSSDSISGGNSSSSDSCDEYTTLSELQKSRYGSAGQQWDSGHSETSRASDRLGQGSLSSSTGSLAEESDKDFKKICETLKAENERLKEKLKKVEDELGRTKKQLDKTLLQNHTRNSLSDAEKRERRTLERKLAEMEEELKNMAKVKTENEKLKAENRALTRVVSKLSK
ncbi:protein phosphatase 1 regulatory subunit 12B-like [Tachypleus tridentatus]|uniref:protein phosphatase 1 regulatory subunit 12B-like n=1 Tax=Tachypleus tridentatus TaxID=6853 RepID=UPI003FD03051